MKTKCYSKWQISVLLHIVEKTRAARDLMFSFFFFSLKKTTFVQKELTFAQPKLYLLKILQNMLGLQVTIISYIS